MGLFSFFKKQLLKVVEWQDDSRDTIVYRFPLTDRDELMTGSTLVVREGQVAIFVHKGEVCDVFTPGTYKLSTENIPFLTKLLSLPAGFESRIKADIYYINTREFIDNKWGTQQPIIMRDAEYGKIHVRSYGSFDFKVSDAKELLKRFVGTGASYKVSDVIGRLKSLVMQNLTKVISTSGVTAVDLNTQILDVSDKVEAALNQEMAELCLTMTRFVIDSFSLPEEINNAITQKNALSELEPQIGTYTRKKAADAMGDAAKNPNGNNLAGLGVGLGAGTIMTGAFAGAIDMTNPPPKPKKVATVACPKCNAEVKATSKFCPECGEKIEKPKRVCPECKTENRANARFCSECGYKFAPSTKKCSKCNAEIKATSKFCPECGEKLN
ncbi:MAG: SPFH domain-containing protein [Clostridiales bacterium]|nr:SPFH domain-containing protein [Clostridiales bacterium]